MMNSLVDKFVIPECNEYFQNFMKIRYIDFEYLYIIVNHYNTVIISHFFY